VRVEVAKWVYWLVIGYTVRGSNHGGSEISAPVRTGPGAYTASYTIGTRSFPKEKVTEACGVDNQPHLMPRLKREYIYTSTSPCAFMSVFRVHFINF